MHAHHALGRRRRGGDLRHRERRRVRREDRVRPADALELGEQGALRLELLDDRLDHEVAGREGLELGRRLEARDRAVPLLLRALALLDLAREEVTDPRRGRLAELVGDLAPDDGEARLDRDLRDPGAHRAEPDDSDLLDLHGGGNLPRPSAADARCRRAACAIRSPIPQAARRAGT